MLQEALWKNYTQARKVEPDLPNLSEEDILLRARDIEYGVFSATTVITIYRRKMALLTSEIKKSTDKFNLYVHDAIETGIPAVSGISSELETENTKSGFVKASDMVFATSVTTEEKQTKLEDEDSSIQAPASPVGSSLFGKKRVSRLVVSENGIVSSSSLLSTPPKRASADSDLIARAKEVEARLSTQLSFMSKSSGADLTAKSTNSASDSDRSSKARNGASKESSKASLKPTSFKSSKRSLDHQTSLDRFLISKRQRLESQQDNCQSDSKPTVSATGKPTGHSTSETLKKEKDSHPAERPIRLESTPSKTEKSKSSSRSGRSDEKIKPFPKEGQKINSSLKTPVKKADKSISSSSSGEKTKSASLDKSKSSPDKSKQDIANLVIRCLMPHYSEKKISSRDLFKALARHLSHVVRSLTPPLTGITTVI